MSDSWNGCLTVSLALSIPAILVGMISSAAAEDFYPFEATEDNAIMFIEPEEIQVSNDGHRIVALHVVSVDSLGLASLDTTTVEVDCTAARWKVVSEYVYLSLSPTAEKIDKTNANVLAWQDISTVGLYQRYRSFTCNWPTLADPTQQKATFSDFRAAADYAALVIRESNKKTATH